MRRGGRRKRRWVSGGFADGDAGSGLGALAKRLTGWVWVEVFGGDRGRQAKLHARRAALVSPNLFFSPGLSPPNPSQAQRVTSTNRAGCHCQPDKGRVIIG